MKKPEPTWRDIQTATKQELMTHYKLTPAGMEQAIRRQMPGAGHKDYEKVYKEFYDKK